MSSGAGIILGRPHLRAWREIAVAALMVMELCWIVPWYRSLTPATYAATPLRAFSVLGGVLLGTSLLLRSMNFLRLRADLRRAGLLLFLLLGGTLGLKTLLYPGERMAPGELIARLVGSFNEWGRPVPDEFIVALAILIACWRGTLLARLYVEPVTIRQDFQLGIYMLLGFISINTFVTGETPGGLIYLYFASGLVAMGAARVSVLNTLRGGGSAPFDRRWFLGILLSTLLVVGLAAAAAGLASERMALVEALGLLAMSAAAVVLVALLSPLIFLAQEAAVSFPGLSNVVGGFTRALADLRTSLSHLAGDLFAVIEESGAFSWALRLKPILLWSGLAAVGFFLLAGLAGWIGRERAGRGEERQSLPGDADLLRLLRQSLQDRLNRLVERLAGAARFPPDRRCLAAARIRRIYAELMELSARLGKARSSSQTPLEFLPALEGLFPGWEGELNLITHAYLRVRYGELPESRQELDEVEAVWARLRARGQEALAEKK